MLQPSLWKNIFLNRGAFTHEQNHIITSFWKALLIIFFQQIAWVVNVRVSNMWNVEQSTKLQWTSVKTWSLLSIASWHHTRWLKCMHLQNIWPAYVTNRIVAFLELNNATPYPQPNVSALWIPPFSHKCMQLDFKTILSCAVVSHFTLSILI